LYIDADEYIEKNYFDSILKIKHQSADAFLLTVESQVGLLNGTKNLITYPRIFKNSKKYFFKYAIHEQIIDSLLENNARIQSTGIKIMHDGYKLPQAQLAKKKERNLEQTAKILKQDPNNLYYLYHYGMSLFSLEKYEALLDPLQKYLRLSKGGGQYVSVLNILAQSLFQLGFRKEAKLFFRQSIKICNNQYFAHNSLADLLMEEKSYIEALNHLEICITLEKSDLSSDHVSDKLTNYIKLGLGYLAINKKIEAQENFEKFIKFAPFSHPHHQIVEKYLTLVQ
jgi:tetratricopeptide (TPR) repeat protein